MQPPIKRSPPVPRKAMILAAGLGSRLKPWTDHHPKALAIVNGKSLLQRNVEFLRQYGFTELIVNVHHFAGQVIEAIETKGGWGSKITISDETEQVLETGGGLQKAAWFFEEGDFVLMNADVLTDMNLGAMLDYHQLTGALATLAVTNRTTSRYFLFDKEDALSGWENVLTGEQKIIRNVEAPQRKAFSGIHIINTSIFSKIKLAGKFSMVDLYLQLAAANTISSFDHSASRFIDVGKPESIITATGLFV